MNLFQIILLNKLQLALPIYSRLHKKNYRLHFTEIDNTAQDKNEYIFKIVEDEFFFLVVALSEKSKYL